MNSQKHNQHVESQAGILEMDIKMTYQLPELSASPSEKTSDDPRELINKFIAFSEISIAKTQALIEKGNAAQLNYDKLSDRPQPLQPLANDSNTSLGK